MPWILMSMCWSSSPLLTIFSQYRFKRTDDSIHPSQTSVDISIASDVMSSICIVAFSPCYRFEIILMTLRSILLFTNVSMIWPCLTFSKALL